MTQGSAAKPREQPSSRRVTRPAIAVLLVLVVVAVYFLYRPSPEPQEGLADLFGPLEELGFTPNVGLSDLYQPGDVIQTQRAVPGGKVQTLASPLPFLWADDCFPGLEPRESRLALPQWEGHGGASLRLGAKALSRVAPSLAIQDAAVVRSSLELQNPHIRTVTPPQVSRSFSKPCVDALNQAQEDEKELEWFQVIVQAVVADTLRFEIDWRSDTSGALRADLKKRTQRALAKGKTEVGVKTDNEKKTVLETEGPVVLAYRALAIDLRSSTTEVISPQAPKPEKAAESEATMPTTDSSGSLDASERKHGVVARLALELRDDESWRQVDLDHGFHSGDFFRFAVTSSHDGWIYVLHRPPGGELGVLWPAEEDDGHRNAVEAKKTFLIPPGPEAFRFDGEVGDELFYVAIAAEGKVPERDGDGESVATPVQRQEHIENFIVRGLHGSARNVVIEKVPDADPTLVFMTPPENAGLPSGAVLAAVEFQLRHQK